MSDLAISRACGRVVELARQLGFGPVEPEVVHAARNIRLWLHPHDLVARVSPSDRGKAAAKLTREIDIVRHLCARGAPVVPVSRDGPPGPHVFDDVVITLWTFVAHVCADQHNSGHVAGAARSLTRVHAALSGLATPLPEFWPKMACVGEALGSKIALPRLGAEDRQFLQSVFCDLERLIGGRRAGSVAIHGDAHLGNVLITAAGPRWNDFEDVCLGPREWDVSALPLTAEAAFSGLDLELLAALRCLRSLCVFFWCWPKREIPRERAAAEHHLAYLRQSPLFASRRRRDAGTRLGAAMQASWRGAQR